MLEINGWCHYWQFPAATVFVIGANLILDSSLRFQLKITKPPKNYLRVFSIVILGAESDSEVKLHLEWVPMGQKWAFLLYFNFLAFWF